MKRSVPLWLALVIVAAVTVCGVVVIVVNQNAASEQHKKDVAKAAALTTTVNDLKEDVATAEEEASSLQTDLYDAQDTIDSCQTAIGYGRQGFSAVAKSYGALLHGNTGAMNSATSALSNIADKWNYYAEICGA